MEKALKILEEIIELMEESKFISTHKNNSFEIIVLSPEMYLLLSDQVGSN